MRFLIYLVVFSLVSLGLASGALRLLPYLRGPEMGFYYISTFSIAPLAIAYLLLLLVFWGIARLMRAVRWRAALLTLLAPVFLVLPVAEELWIAWNFGQACKEAGTFIYKKVEVEGFYDETRPARLGPLAEQAKRSMDESGYRFHERPFFDRRSGSSEVVRFEKVGGEWAARLLDRPTARYHYSWPQRNAIVGHKMFKQIEAVTDVQTNEVVGRSVQYGRTSPWFFVALDDPGMSCPRPDEKAGVLLYRLVLEPAVAK